MSRSLFTKLILSGLCLLLFWLPAQTIFAESLWVDEAANIYQDKVASAIGDLVTIIVTEESKATQKASTNTSQDSKVSGGPGLGIFDFVKSFSVDYDDKNSADGSTTRQDALDASITAQIVAIQPNGNFMIRGYKMINLNGENQEMEISGIIRQEDIKANNTIQSTYMTDVEIRYSGQGVVSDKQKAGLLEKFFNWLF